MVKSDTINGVTIYKGSIGDITIFLCPNKIANVVAKQNRHQLKIKVSDLNKTLIEVEKKGCEIKDKTIKTRNQIMASIVDPDENSIELIQELNSSNTLYKTI
jgi:hypothetical protein